MKISAPAPAKNPGAGNPAEKAIVEDQNKQKTETQNSKLMMGRPANQNK